MNPDFVVENKWSRWFTDFNFFQDNVEVFKRQVSVLGWTTSEMWRAHFKELQVILYLDTGTDSAQPIRVFKTLA